MSARKPRILVIGEPMHDHYITGQASRLSPEAPLPVVRVVNDFVLPGGAANVARNLEACGAEVKVCFPAPPWPTKSRLVCDGVMLARWDSEDYYLYPALTLPSPQGFDAVVISDYGKGVFTQDLKENLQLALADFPSPVLIDTKAGPEGWPDAIFFPNFREYGVHRDEYARCAQVVRTLGSEGLEYLYYGQRKFYLRATAERVASVVGAGDTVIAAYAFGVAQGWAPELCLAYARDCAASAVEQPYTAVPTQEVV